MPDIINLLPDNIANQIAAGEVIQRPASAIKELMENAIDAGATEVKVILKDAGKALIQVIDNGCGMSPSDARMSFERHATSKIRNIDDLFAIRTMGFRGEALASVAAVAQVELKTRRHEDELGTQIIIEGTDIKSQEPCATAPGTSFAIKNLFYNVPARRNFLKSHSTELKHIMDEFTRVALSFPHIFFSLNHNGQEVFHLERGNLKQRVMGLLGNNLNAKLVPVKEETDYLTINGFVGKPDAANKTRGNQFFFVNNRFIKSTYLNHAVTRAFEGLIEKETFPLYVLFIELDPKHIDINVHPTKQEIKFDDEKIVYAFVQAAIKRALAQFSIMPSLDFDLDPSIQSLEAINRPFTNDKQEETRSSYLYKTFSSQGQAHMIEKNGALDNWNEMYKGAEQLSRPASGASSASSSPSSASGYSGRTPAEGTGETVGSFRSSGFPAFPSMPSMPEATPQRAAAQPVQKVLIPEQQEEIKGLLQLHQQYILSSIRSGFILIDQSLAHQRILYERYASALMNKPVATQQNLFPLTLQLTASDYTLLDGMLEELHTLGYLLEPFGKNAFVIQGTPADVEQGNEQKAIEQVLEQFKHYSSELRLEKRESLLRSLARSNAIAYGKILTQKEMQTLIDELFACAQPNFAPNGKPTFITITLEEVRKMFNG